VLKKRHTIKVEFVASKREKKIKRVRIEKGKVHDFEMYKQQPVKLGKNKIGKLDKGYQGIQKMQSQCEVPIKKKKGQKLTKEEKRFNRQHSKERIIVEHVNRKVKVFRIFSSKYRNRRNRFGIRINLIAAIINLMPF